MNEQLEIALDDCLNSLASGRETLDACLGRYPGLTPELRPLLTAAARLQQAGQLIPAPGAKARLGAQLAARIDSHARPPRVNLTLRMAVSIVASMLALLVFTTAFAQGALPGQPLYALKLSTERVWRAASPDPVGVDLQLAERRADELVSISRGRAAKGETDPAELAGIAAYNDVLGHLEGETNGPHGAEILSTLHGNQEQLNQAGVHIEKLDNIVSHGKSGDNPGQGPKKP